MGTESSTPSHTRAKVLSEWTGEPFQALDERLPEFIASEWTISAGSRPENLLRPKKCRRKIRPPDAFHIPTPNTADNSGSVSESPRSSRRTPDHQALHLMRRRWKPRWDKNLSHPPHPEFHLCGRNLLVISVRHVSLLTAFRNPRGTVPHSGTRRRTTGVPYFRRCQGRNSVCPP